MAIVIRKTPTLLPGNVRWGVLNETGINISRFQVRYFPEVDVKIPGDHGLTLLRVVSGMFSRQIELEGEVIGTDGVMAFTLGEAIAYAFKNSVQDLGPVIVGGVPTARVGGSIYVDDVTIISMRSGWKKVTIRASSVPSL